MLESLDIRVAKNGFIVTVIIDGDSEEHIFETERRLMKFVRDMLRTYVPSDKAGDVE